MTDLDLDLDLDVNVPEKVAAVLRRAAVKYAESHIELQSAWQDPQAGKIWSRIAGILDSAANRIEREVNKDY